MPDRERRQNEAWTLGFAASYDAALARATADDPMLKSGEHDDYQGGWVWASLEAAQAFLMSVQFAQAFPGRDPDEFAVYRLALPGGWDIDVSADVAGDGVHRLLNDATITRREPRTHWRRWG